MIIFVVASALSSFRSSGLFPAFKIVSAAIIYCSEISLHCFEAQENDAKENAQGNAKENDGSADVTVKLAGAKQCSVKEIAGSQPGGLGTQFVCYWREASGSAAQTRFRDLVSRLQILIPSNWSTHQQNELDDSTGAEITAWYAIEPGSKHDVRVYVSVESVGLHVTAWN